MNNQIEVLYNSEVIGKFNKLQFTFRGGFSIGLEDEPQLAFVLEEGYFDSKAILKLFESKPDRSLRFTIKFTVEDKDYFIYRGNFDSMTAVEDVVTTTGRKALYSRIEGVGEIKVSEIPVEFIKHGLSIGYE